MMRTESKTGVVSLKETSPILEFHNVGIQYGDAAHPAVSSVHLSIYKGESVLFLGPSGSGKSTLALLCADVIPRAVEARVSGEIIRDPLIQAPGSIGYVFQDPDAQFAMLTSADEVAFGLENLQVEPNRMMGRVQSAVGAAGLDVPLWMDHSEFSGGMKQKLAIASALAMNPHLLVFDEPTANLDPHSSRAIFDLIGKFHDESRTQIVIEHKFDLLIPHMDRVVLFDGHGQIHRVGPTEEVILEEWEWMKQIGVVPEWKREPDWVKPTFSGERERIHHADYKSIGNTALSVDHATSAISVRAAGKAYKRGRFVWNDVNLDIPNGSFTAIVGPNGAGKSTLLQVCAGLEQLTCGDVFIEGKNLRSFGHKIYSHVSFCFQNPEFQFIYERVADELANRVVDGPIPQEVVQLLCDFELQGLEQMSPFSLSQGQKRRLSVASMLREDHEVYLLDEPTFGQDAKTQESIMRKLSSLHESGKTVIITTHDMDSVRRYATQVIVMADEAVRFVGSPEELFRLPEVLGRAHLLDDVTVEIGHSAKKTDDELVEDTSFRAMNDGMETDFRQLGQPEARYTQRILNPAAQLITYLVAMVIAVFANTLPRAAGEFAIPLSLLFVVARLSPLRVFKRLSPFILFYVFYIWSMTAYARVSPGTKTLDILWWHLSEPGLVKGLVLAFRMVAAASFGVLFFSVVDVTDFIVSLSQNLRIPPRFAYGTLAGIRVLPLFESEWQKLKRARQLRGKDAKWAVLRPVQFSIPLLSQAIRMSERVAIAMEARGFHGAPAEFAGERTYFRRILVRPRDAAYGSIVIGLCLLVLWLL